MGDPYEILGVGPDATGSELRAAYRREALRRHPDAGGSDRAMAELTVAWSELSARPAGGAADRRSVPAPAPAGGTGPAGAGAAPRWRRRPQLRLWMLLVAGAVGLIVATAYAGAPGVARRDDPLVGRCITRQPGTEAGATTAACGPAGTLVVAVGGPVVRCPDGAAATPVTVAGRSLTACTRLRPGR